MCEDCLDDRCDGKSYVELGDMSLCQHDRRNAEILNSYKDPREMIEIEEHYELGKLSKFTANGVELPIDTPLEDTGMVIQRKVMSQEEFDNSYGNFLRKVND